MDDEDLVTIRMMPADQKQVVASYSSTAVPTSVQYSLRTDPQTKQQELTARDDISDMTFTGQLPDKHSSEYYVGIRKEGILEVYPMSMFQMKPVFEMSDAIANRSATQTPLTFKEQLDEMKEKFGSRRTQRQLASKRKYAIHLGEDDVANIETQTQSVAENNTQQQFIGDTIDILPKQNRSAICVEEVYDLNEIITENERSIIKLLETELFDAIESPFIKHLTTNSSIDSEHKLIAIYINLILSLLNLKGPDLKKSDPLPTLDAEVKNFLFERYLSIESGGRNKCKYILSDKQKDRLLIYGIILSLIHNNYRPLEMESIQKTFKVQPKPLRKLVEIIGCFVETMKNASGLNAKFAVFKIPLNEIKETKKKFR